MPNEAGQQPELERQWQREMIQIHAEARAIGYNAPRFIQKMMDEQGGLEAARWLINSDEPSDEFTKLWELQRLDIAVEARALKPEYESLFKADELERCRKRLSDYYWTRQPPWGPPAWSG